jgi:RNA polymerase sigma factor (sigma-70 family)
MNLEERNKKVEENLKLVSYALNLLKVPWNEDYFQQGVLELIRCVEKFDDTKGYQFSTYATRCITLKLKDYIKRDYVIKPKRTGEPGGKVWAPSVVSISNTVYEDSDDRPIKGEDVVLSCTEDWEYLDLKMELDLLVKDGVLTQQELDIFIDGAVNQYTAAEIAKKYNIKKFQVNSIISKVRIILQEDLSYNYYEGS